MLKPLLTFDIRRFIPICRVTLGYLFWLKLPGFFVKACGSQGYGIGKPMVDLVQGCHQLQLIDALIVSKQVCLYLHGLWPNIA